jgi:hypothetical protein
MDTKSVRNRRLERTGLTLRSLGKVGIALVLSWHQTWIVLLQNEYRQMGFIEAVEFVLTSTRPRW